MLGTMDAFVSVDGTGRAPWHGLQKEGGLDRCLQLRLPSVPGLEMLAVWLGFRTFLPDLKGHHILICLDSMTVVSYINHQGGDSLSSRRLFTLAEHLFRWAQLSLRSLRAAHVPGKLNVAADMLSRSNVPSGKWTLHPQMVQIIWGIFDRPEVDLFAS